MTHSPLRRRLQRLPLALAVLGSAAFAQDIELYDRPDFAGDRAAIERSVPDLSTSGVGGSVGSIVVHRGEWELCSEPGFTGRCVTLSPGRYAALPSGLGGQIASLRDTRGSAQEAPRARSRDAAIVLYADDDFRGRRLPRDEASANLSWMGFDDRARAVDVRDGEWQLCSEADYRGRCLVLGPGRHVLPEGYAGRISSLRPAGSVPIAAAPRPGPEARITLYDQSNLRGRWLRTTGSIPNLGAEEYDNVARSVDVQGGRWELCSGRDFSGECLVLRPGRHALPQQFAGRVSSIRPLG